MGGGTHVEHGRSRMTSVFAYLRHLTIDHASLPRGVSNESGGFWNFGVEKLVIEASLGVFSLPVAEKTGFDMCLVNRGCAGLVNRGCAILSHV